MRSSRFESSRSGVPHRYEIKADGLSYSAGMTMTTSIAFGWDQLERLAPGPNGEIYLRRHKHQPLAIWLDAKDMPAFLDALFAAWGQADRGKALKAAFDYGADRRTLGWISLAVTLFFPGFLTALLWANAFNTLHCNTVFESGTRLAPAQVTDIKTSRGKVFWTLEGTTPEGGAFKGSRSAFVHDEHGRPTGDVFVAYAPKAPQCWEVSLKTNEPEVPRAQRHASLLRSMGVGLAFALVTALALAFSLTKLLKNYPYRKEVTAAGARIAPAGA